MAPTMDHIIPKSAGGKATMNNLRLAHRDCNGRRGDPEPTTQEYAQVRGAVVVDLEMIEAQSNPEKDKV